MRKTGCFALWHAAELAGEKLLEIQAKMEEGYRLQEREKAPGDWVTEADEIAQEIMIPELKIVFPDDVYVAEEGDTIIPENGRAHIFIDPVDGTAYYRRGSNMFSVTLARYSAEGIVGVILRPAAPFEDVYFAVTYQGCKQAMRFRPERGMAFLKLSIFNSPFVPRVLVCQPVRYERLFTALLRAGFDAQMAPPCTFACIDVAEGLADAYVAPGGFGKGNRAHQNMKWDFCAGAPLVIAAGGVGTKISGEPLGLEHSSLLVARNMDLHLKLVETLKPFTPENNFGEQDH